MESLRSSCRAPSLGASFARTLSGVERFMHALLNEERWNCGVWSLPRTAGLRR
jgi:hypothetical protein